MSYAGPHGTNASRNYRRLILGVAKALFEPGDRTGYGYGKALQKPRFGNSQSNIHRIHSCLHAKVFWCTVDLFMCSAMGIVTSGRGNFTGTAHFLHRHHGENASGCVPETLLRTNLEV